ncbi:hypothetical protein FKW77_008087 [Venturia effusa]|uniref:Uncharacterized protein n=1 Tax=Venturia effusa TaxID=50376 RepID=A0A517LG34_9PEZI|nr:hypothetical protein FKW77_008087 [Venturia effusa]
MSLTELSTISQENLEGIYSPVRYRIVPHRTDRLKDRLLLRLERCMSLLRPHSLGRIMTPPLVKVITEDSKRSQRCLFCFKILLSADLFPQPMDGDQIAANSEESSRLQELRRSTSFLVDSPTPDYS